MGGGARPNLALGSACTVSLYALMWKQHHEATTTARETTMSTYTKEQAKAVDAKLAKDQKALYKALPSMDALVERMARVAGAKRIYIGRKSYLSFNETTVATGLEALKKLIEHRDSDAVPSWELPRIEQMLTEYDKLALRINTLKSSIDAAHQEWADHGMWSRFFIVAGGHIHSSTHCHTLKITTRLGWLPELSGETEKDAVDAHGALLCTVCFPSAPVEWTIGAKPADDECEGGRPEDADFRRRSVYGTCPSCGEWVSVTRTGKARKHKKPAKEAK